MMYYDTIGESSNSYLRHVLLNELLAGQDRAYLEAIVEHEHEKSFQFDPENAYLILTGIPKSVFYLRYGVGANRAMSIFVTLEQELRPLMEKHGCRGEFIIHLYKEKQFVALFSPEDRTHGQEIAEQLARFCCYRLQALYEQEYLQDGAFANVTLLSENLHAWEEIGPTMQRMLEAWKTCAFFHMEARVWKAAQWMENRYADVQTNEALHRIRQAINHGDAGKARIETHALFLTLKTASNWYALSETLGIIKHFEQECIQAYDLLSDGQLNAHYESALYPSIDSLSEGIEERLFNLAEEIRIRELHYSPLVQKAVRVLKESFMHREISLTFVADRLNVSPSYLSGVFKRETGDALTHYIVSLRMKRACALLRDSDLRVSEIAERVGFDDKRYFTAVFRREIGSSPSTYREQVRKD